MNDSSKSTVQFHYHKMLSSRLVRLPFNKNNCFSFFNANNLRAISTSKKNSEATVAAADTAAKTKTETAAAPGWQSFGFHDTDQKEDRAHMHLSCFFGITLCIVFTSFYVAYAPAEIDWEQREAFLELRRRERLGLPPVDPNYIDPKLMILPSDEELGDEEIII